MPHVPVDAVGTQIQRMREVTGTATPVTVYAVPDDQKTLEQYAELDVEQALLFLPTLPEQETLRALDEMTNTIAAYR
jgi:hypothetical protein